MTPFAWSAFLDLAVELALRTGDEAAARTAISRAYYAAFGTARGFLLQRGVGLPSGGLAHAAVWGRFHVTPDPIHRRIADRGRVLRKLRGRADYDERYPISTKNATNAVWSALGLLTDLATLSAAATPSSAPDEPT